MAIRHLNYCTNCGWMLLGHPTVCGHCGAPADGAASPPERPVPYLVPPSVRVPARFGRRAAAGAIDLVLGGGAAWLGWAIGTRVSVIAEGVKPAMPGNSLIALVVAAVVLLGYQPLAWVRWGRTPGMALVGLRLVRTDGSRLRIRHALLREVAMAGSVALGFKMPLERREMNRQPDLYEFTPIFHDRVAGTEVIEA